MTSAPVSSQTLAISLMNEIFVARKALEASFTISAEAMSVRTSGRVQRRVERDDGVTGPVAVVADDDAGSGARKSLTAEPSFRNSGQET